MKKRNIILLLSTILFLFILILIMFNNISYNIPNCKLSNFYESKLLKLNKIIIVGDSRMYLIQSERELLNIPNSIIFDAKNGAKIDWFIETGYPNLEKLLDKYYISKYNYNIVFNLGVNDLDSDLNVKKIAQDYYNVYKKIANKYYNLDFYFLSVNPIDEKILKAKRTNKKIIEFNNYIKNKIDNEKVLNLKYCDSFNSIDFVLPDGLHYDNNTNKKIINYIINECINKKNKKEII